jgi:hypothetical protein
MTANLPMPSAQVANKATQPRFRFFYPFAAVCVAMALLAPPSTQAQTNAPKLRPDQERAIELMLQEVEPAVRPMARQQLALSFANFNEAQVAMMVAKYKDNKAAEANRPVPVAEVETVATPADLAYNKAQYEPVIRKHHKVQKEFDAFANEKMASYCPGRDQYARFGPGWRFEQGQFVMESALATWNVETNVAVTDEAYAPKDGRYQFDFSKVRMSFDKAAVETAIKATCDKVHAAGKAFLAKIDPLIALEDWNGAFKAEGWAQNQLEPIRAELKAKFDKLSPGDFTEIQLALMNGRKIK